MPSLPILIAKNLLLGLPPVRRAYRRRQTAAGCDPGKDARDYVVGVFRKHAQALGPCGGRDVLEIGPGGNLAVALQFLLGGARSVTAIDVVPYAAKRLSALYLEVATALGRPQDAGRVDEIRYLAPTDIHDPGLPSASFDIIYSHACFEHFLDPGRAIGQIARLLRPAGRTSHQIDLADHVDRSDPLGFLRHHPIVWRLASSNGGNWATNRWRASDFRAAFRDAGLDVVHEHATDRIPVSAEDRSALAAVYRGYDLDDLATTGLLLVAEKPPAASHAQEPTSAGIK
jgi:SAM-dependent methyltransferase